MMKKKSNPSFKIFKKYTYIVLSIIIATMIFRCTKNETLKSTEIKILFLHHSTGNVIYYAGNSSRLNLSENVPKWFKNYNKQNKTSYSITEQYFPKQNPYGWNNYPYDYYNIWVKNAGEIAYMEEPTLEILTKQYDVIIFKHCFPVSGITENTGTSNINSAEKKIENYKLQYQALKEKLLQFPETKFIVWTGAALVKLHTNENEAKRAKAFFNWVKSEWDNRNDNIYIWDFFELETEGGLYLKPEFAETSDDSHPNKEFAKSVVPFFCKRIIDVIENSGKNTTLTGK